ncbi:TPA: hypothetical protein DF272_05820 [Candidatus Falkowbacteria bacterium]|nr:hypothetical protein [Candidatus Falkowbacteria bacterium]
MKKQELPKMESIKLRLKVLRHFTELREVEDTSYDYNRIQWYDENDKLKLPMPEQYVKDLNEVLEPMKVDLAEYMRVMCKKQNKDFAKEWSLVEKLMSTVIEPSRINSDFGPGGEWIESLGSLERIYENELDDIEPIYTYVSNYSVSLADFAADPDEYESHSTAAYKVLGDLAIRVRYNQDIDFKADYEVTDLEMFHTDLKKSMDRLADEARELEEKLARVNEEKERRMKLLQK